MSPGKLAAQAGHAFLGAQFAAQDNPTHNALAAAYAQEAPGTKVVLSAPLWRILELRKACEDQGIPHFLVIDEGHIHPPHFEGQPIETAIGIGPLRRAAASQLLKRLPAW